jgi:hypothetical protein
MYHHPDLVALMLRQQEEQLRRAAGHSRLLRDAKRHPDKRRWRRR